jgi:hypothetical protein
MMMSILTQPPSFDLSLFHHIFVIMCPSSTFSCYYHSKISTSSCLVMGHWDVPVFDIPNGLEPGMSVEAIHLRMRTLPACAALPQRKFKYIYGHTHCNRMMLRDTSYLVAGQGMDGCGIYGFPGKQSFSTCHHCLTL